MTELTEPLWQSGVLRLTPYGLCMGLATLAAVLLTVAAGRKRHSTGTLLSACLATLAGAVIGGHLLWCLGMLDTVLTAYESGSSLFYRLYLGGYTLPGGVLGGLTGLWLYARCTRQSTAQLLDALAPGAALGLAIGRMAEHWNAQGLGDYIDNKALQFFPIAVCTYDDGDWSEWRLAVFFWEALAALVILAVLLVRRGKVHRDGELAAEWLILVSASQVFLEQLRLDDCVRFHSGFIRLAQVAALAALLAVLAMRLHRAIRRRGRHWRDLCSVGLTAFSAGTITLIEFAVEKPEYLPWLRICLAAAVLLLALAQVREKRLPLRAIIELGLGAAAVVLLCLSLEWESTLLYVVMAAMCFALGWAVWTAGDGALEGTEEGK